MRRWSWVSAAAVAALLGAMIVPTTAEAQSAREKFNRGLANVVFGVLELPGTVIEESRASHPVQGLTVGVVKGLFRTIRREVVGAYEIVSFPVEIPAGFEKIVSPEYAWEYYD